MRYLYQFLEKCFDQYWASCGEPFFEYLQGSDPGLQEREHVTNKHDLLESDLTRSWCFAGILSGLFIIFHESGLFLKLIDPDLTTRPHPPRPHQPRRIHHNLFHQQQLLLSISSTTTPSKFHSSLQLIKPSNLWKFIKFLLQLLLKTPNNLDPIIQSLNQKFQFFHFCILTIIRT